MLSANDNDRRTKLTAFLAECRSRVNRADVGLPATNEPPVRGLTREETAELTDVTSPWYRRFESGRAMRASVPFLARLSRALRLTPVERMALYYPALPEIYEAHVAQRAS